MGKKVVLLPRKVYDLGLKEMSDAISAGESEGRTMEIEVDLTVFQVGVIRQERAVALHWTGMTNLRNIVWQRFVLLRFRWPPVQSLSYFTDSEEKEDYES